MLKIDTEGLDFDVITGFIGALSAGNIRMIQFEVSQWNAVVGVWVREWFEYLTPLDYALGRVFPGYVQPLTYHAGLEEFRHRANFVAVQRGDARLRECVFGDTDGGETQPR